MTISAKIIADSISLPGKRITTFQLRYPRFIHAELMTHRVFSRNASSSRAIPVERLIEDIKRDTAMPSHWGKNQPGMQAHEECHEQILLFSHIDRRLNKLSRGEAWFAARDRAIEVAEQFHKAGYHKQIVNRLLEPFSHINVVVTATEFENWFALRFHRDAQPEIRILAGKMLRAIRDSAPERIENTGWHLPYFNMDDWEEVETQMGPRLAEETARKVSAARCARVSYLTHDGKKPDIEADLALFDRLAGGVPLHASPMEHQATPVYRADQVRLQGNFNGWAQFRKMLPNENAEFLI